MPDWTEKYSSLELLESLKDDLLESLYDAESNDRADNIDASLQVVKALIDRQRIAETLIS